MIPWKECNLTAIDSQTKEKTNWTYLVTIYSFRYNLVIAIVYIDIVYLALSGR